MTREEIRVHLGELFPKGVNVTVYQDDTFPEDPENIQFISPSPVLVAPDTYVVESYSIALTFRVGSIEEYPKVGAFTSIIIRSADGHGNYWLTDVIP